MLYLSVAFFFTAIGREGEITIEFSADHLDLTQTRYDQGHANKTIFLVSPGDYFKWIDLK
jgi:hypothetical protein